MKKIAILIALFMSGTMNTALENTNVEDFLSDCTAPEEISVDTQVATTLVSLFKNEDFLARIGKSLKKNASEEVVNRLKFILALNDRLKEIQENSDFLAQAEKAMAIVEKIKNSEDPTEEEMGQAQQVLQKECPLYCEFGAIVIELDSFKQSFLQVMEGVEIDSIFNRIVKHI